MLERLLEDSTGTVARGVLAAELAKARPDMLRVLAGHLGCLRTLNIWLLDLASDLRACQVLEAILQVRQAFMRDHVLCHCSLVCSSAKHLLLNL